MKDSIALLYTISQDNSRPRNYAVFYFSHARRCWHLDSRFSDPRLAAALSKHFPNHVSPYKRIVIDLIGARVIWANGDFRDRKLPEGIDLHGYPVEKYEN